MPRKSDSDGIDGLLAKRKAEGKGFSPVEPEFLDSRRPFLGKRARWLLVLIALGIGAALLFDFLQMESHS